MFPLAAYAQVLLRGTVHDPVTDEPLPAAHVEVAGTERGSITNAQGAFSLVVPRLPVRLRVRYIGYQTTEVEVGVDDVGASIDIRPERVVYELGEIFVAGDELAENILRRVIARKQRQRAHLNAYAADGYARLTLAKDSTLVLVSEKVFDVLWDQNLGRRSVITSRRETANFYRRLGIEPADLPNFYDDLIEIQGLSFISPTHPDALDHYNVNLAERRKLDDLTVYDLYIAPKSVVDAAFIGRVSVLDSLDVLLEVEVRPARFVTFEEPVTSWDVFYRQQFSPAADSFWLPVDLRAEGRFTIPPGVFDFPEVALQQTARFTNYRINPPLPEAPFRTDQRVQVDSAAVFRDDLFLRGRNIVPLTGAEEDALRRLTPQQLTLEEALLSRRQAVYALFFARRNLIDEPQLRWPRYKFYELRTHYNRVDASFFGVGQWLPFSPRFEMLLRVGQTTGTKRLHFEGIATYRWGRGGTLEATYIRDTALRYESHVYTKALNTLPARFGGTDYFDYYKQQGVHATLTYAWPFVRAALTLREEVHDSVEKERARAWPFEHTFRSNPAIEDGTFRTATVQLIAGESNQTLGAQRLRRAEVRAEHALPGSASTFTRFDVKLDGWVPTFARLRPQPNALAVRAYGTTFSGTLPPQRLGIVDGTDGPFAGLGGLRTRRNRPYEGEQALGVFWEHDFTTLPFEALRLRPLVDREIGLRVFGGHGRTWLSDERAATLDFAPLVSEGWHHEAGISVTNLFNLLRVDVARRLDTPDWGVTVGVSRRF